MRLMVSPRPRPAGRIVPSMNWTRFQPVDIWSLSALAPARPILRKPLYTQGFLSLFQFV
jgi:hypothetical protein